MHLWRRCRGRRGQHASLEALQRRMRPKEMLMACRDDIYFASKPERVGDVVAASVQELWAHARIRVHGGKTHIWNRDETPGRQAEETDPDARVWRGSEVHTTEHQSVGDSSGSRRFCQPAFGTDPAEAQKTLEENPHTSCEGCLVVRSGHGPQAEVAQGVGPGPLVEL